MNSSIRQHSHLIAVESLRGIAALMILLLHLVALVGIPLPNSFGFVRSQFSLGVPLFFTLSGFVLAYGYADKLMGRQQVMVFYIRRLFRIAPLFYTVLLFWLVAQWLIWRNYFSSQTLFLNLSFLFGLVPGKHESIVWAGWSIGTEMLFYFVFPIVVIVLHDVRSSAIGFLVACVLSAAIADAFQGSKFGTFADFNLITHLPFFLAGVACYHVWRHTGFLRHRFGLALLALAVLATAWLVTDYAQALLKSFHFGALDKNAWALVFVLLILSVCLSNIPFLVSGPLRHLGKVSFSIYLIHPIVCLALIKIEFVSRLKETGMGVESIFFIGTVLAVIVVWAVSSLTFRFIESPGIELGRRMSKRFSEEKLKPASGLQTGS